MLLKLNYEKRDGGAEVELFLHFQDAPPDTIHLLTNIQGQTFEMIRFPSNLEYLNLFRRVERRRAKL